MLKDVLSYALLFQRHLSNIIGIAKSIYFSTTANTVMECLFSCTYCYLVPVADVIHSFIHSFVFIYSS